MFQSEFHEGRHHWVQTDRRVALRVLELVEAVMRDPFRGIGKPESLKYLAPDVWSRPRPRAGGRPLHIIPRHAPVPVSIHAPAQGATGFKDHSRLVGVVSIHAPAQGATRTRHR